MVVPSWFEGIKFIGLRHQSLVIHMNAGAAKCSVHLEEFEVSHNNRKEEILSLPPDDLL